MKLIFHFRFLILLGAVLAPCALAQNSRDIPLLRPEEKQVIDEQSTQFNEAIAPALQDAAKSTVRVYYRKERLAYGTVIGKGLQVLTKWSEVKPTNGAGLVVENGAGKLYPAAVSGIYPDEDLVALDISGEALKPVAWSEVKLPLGSFLTAPQPDGRMAGFGVLGVQERNLRETDHAFLGVVYDDNYTGSGLKVGNVLKDSGAEKAGIKRGDILRRIAGRELTGIEELRAALVGVQPGDHIMLQIERDGNTSEVEAVLGSRPDFPEFMAERARQMETMGTDISQVRDSFPNAIQTDMNITPQQIGGPVVNLKGEVIGITVARADRTRTFVMPAATVREVLAKPGMDVKRARAYEQEQLAQKRTRQQEQMAQLRQQRQNRPEAPGPQEPRVRPRRQLDEEQLEQRMQEMRRMMRFLQQEMEDLEKNK